MSSSTESFEHIKFDQGYDRTKDPWAGFLYQDNANHILLSLSPYEGFFGPKPWLTPQVEPPPEIDYYALHMMIDLCRSSLDPRVLKRWEYLAESRKSYFCIHHKFFMAFHGLQDARSFEEIMAKRMEDLKERIRSLENEGIIGSSIGSKKRDLEDSMIQIGKNRIDMLKLTKTVSELAKSRDQTASWLSRMKSDIITSDLQQLVYMTQKIYENAMSQKPENSRSFSRLLQQAQADFEDATTGGESLSKC